MTMILFAEKPNAAVGYIHHIRKLNPEGGDLITIFAHNNHLLQPQFQFPHHLKVRDLPAVRPVAFKPLQFEDFLPPRRNVSTITLDEAVAAVSSAAKIYVQGGRLNGFAVADRLAGWVRDRNPEASILLAQAQGLENAHFHYAVEDARPLGEYRLAIDAANIRLFFDYNYILNSHPMIADAFAKIGRKGARHIGKTPLQLLYWFRRRARGKGRYVQSHDVTHAMRNWQGTGKYPVSGISGTRFGLGAEEFQNYALHTLVDRGLVAEANSRFTLSEDGDAFLDVFHPDCEDADQPFRTAAWTCLPVEEAEEAIGRYIRTFFGKQRHFIGKLPHILLDGTIRYPAAGKEA
jgi:hypothetical protein